VQIDGHPWNHKKVHRVYEAIHFNKRKPLRKRLPARVKNPLVTPDQENVTWSMDFVTDVLQSNRKFRVLNVIDDSDRVAVAHESCAFHTGISLDSIHGGNHLGERQADQHSLR
jgi:putative transposase